MKLFDTSMDVSEETTIETSVLIEQTLSDPDSETLCQTLSAHVMSADNEFENNFSDELYFNLKRNVENELNDYQKTQSLEQISNPNTPPSVGPGRGFEGYNLVPIPKEKESGCVQLIDNLPIDYNTSQTFDSNIDDNPIEDQIGNGISAEDQNDSVFKLKAAEIAYIKSEPNERRVETRSVGIDAQTDLMSNQVQYIYVPVKDEPKQEVKTEPNEKTKRGRKSLIEQGLTPEEIEERRRKQNADAQRRRRQKKRGVQDIEEPESPPNKVAKGPATDVSDSVPNAYIPEAQMTALKTVAEQIDECEDEEEVKSKIKYLKTLLAAMLANTS